MSGANPIVSDQWAQWPTFGTCGCCKWHIIRPRLPCLGSLYPECLIWRRSQVAKGNTNQPLVDDWLAKELLAFT
jgi:hypothetical protein